MDSLSALVDALASGAVEAIAHVEHGDGASQVVDLIDDAILANPYPPALASCSLRQPGGRGASARPPIASRTRA